MTLPESTIPNSEMSQIRANLPVVSETKNIIIQYDEQMFNHRVIQITSAGCGALLFTGTIISAALGGPAFLIGTLAIATIGSLGALYYSIYYGGPSPSEVSESIYGEVKSFLENFIGKISPGEETELKAICQIPIHGLHKDTAIKMIPIIGSLNKIVTLIQKKFPNQNVEERGENGQLESGQDDGLGSHHRRTGGGDFMRNLRRSLGGSLYPDSRGSLSPVREDLGYLQGLAHVGQSGG